MMGLMGKKDYVGANLIKMKVGHSAMDLIKQYQNGDKKPFEISILSEKIFIYHY